MIVTNNDVYNYKMQYKYGFLIVSHNNQNNYSKVMELLENNVKNITKFCHWQNQC